MKSTLGNTVCLRLRHLDLAVALTAMVMVVFPTRFVSGSFWEQNTNMRASKLAHLAQDLLCAPASQAFVERVFSLCGILTAGRRSSMRKSLEMRVFLKLNQKVLKQTGFHL